MNEEERLLVKIAQMYYQEDKTQSQISKELNIHRSTISRLLKQSRQEGIVQITIDYDKAGTYSIEEKIEKKFGINKAIVVPAPKDLATHQKNVMLGKACNKYLKEIIKDNMTIGFSWGHAMAAVSTNLEDFNRKNITCIPLVGGPSGRLDSHYHVNTVTYEASKNIHARALLIDAPAFPETVQLKKALMDNAFNQQLIQYWRELNIAIFGIGSPTMKDSQRWRHFYGDDIFTYLEENQVAGDVVSRFFDAKGSPIKSELDARIIGIDIQELKKVPQRIGVAESREKAAAIRGALMGGYCNVLVTTQETAELILQF